MGELLAPTATSALPTAASATAEPSLAMSTKAQLVRATNRCSRSTRPTRTVRRTKAVRRGGPGLSATGRPCSFR
ncbi:PE-PGRS family domain protein [Mycobacterium ulcerans str. Harvey]|uniref:PE-PGRS family domain protein n=1 Tax=Mycobacterium ulcerans str. Harvey TaxID=1299332 RepID=A0ABP3A729_MYCUL|nr:PE-PGRS family domain protein [Mycobacterium ulcerans str. Harvey]